ncbi:MAG: 4-hydroxybenzoyl-CoA reductase subunit beta [Planctomycetes bacterium]|nr:4-hydroxybenzoyl-CoA reductase subunit beta [Planctomycetota bacterium]
MLILPEFKLERPKSLAEALDAARRADGKCDFLGGGTDLLCNYKWGINTRPVVISLRGIAEMNRRDGRRVGGGVTLASLERDADFLDAFPGFRGALARLASPLIRETGTVAGNILLDTRCIWLNQTEFARKALGNCLKADGPECRVVKGSTDRCYANYSGDTAPLFMVHGASARLASPRGERSVPLTSFFRIDGITRFVKERDEVLVSLDMPPDAAEIRSSYQKLRVREAWDFAEVATAVGVRFDGPASKKRIGELRIVANAVASIPLWLEDVAKPFAGRTLDEATIDAIGDSVTAAVQPVRATWLPPSYRKQMAGVMAKRALREIAAGVA